MTQKRIFIVVGEASGDMLGARLIADLKALLPDYNFEGITGPKMTAAGCACFYPQERLAVFGAFELFHRLRELRAIYYHVYHCLKDNPPDVFIGIDAPAFNLSMEKKLRAHGIKTVHYVSPSVWAWRPSRVKTITEGVNLMLTLFPFEVDFYQRHRVPVSFVGHPLARMIPMHSDKQMARETLGLPLKGPLLGLLPGSRMSEVDNLTQSFLQTAKHCVDAKPDLQIVIGLANDKIQQRVRALYESSELSLAIHFVTGRSLQVMAASDVLLIASGTATLEAMLIKRPMVVAYRINVLSYWLIAKWLVKTRFISLPNILADENLVPEFIQYDIDAAKMADELLRYLDDADKGEVLQARFKAIHQRLLASKENQAAEAIQQLLAI